MYLYFYLERQKHKVKEYLRFNIHTTAKVAVKFEPPVPLKTIFRVFNKRLDSNGVA